ncbi:hypothetical protein HBZ99_004099 [Salmonella enterica subsp. enterica]|uniref:Uncharacterized protein n=1 Tax=Salmonella enterica subsp. enterica serovar Java TaxID=224729 RepID=A0A3Z6QK81_SALEB|nr:hypothetical protein [Salmonella enterica subsp. enterica serovar Java]EBK4665409.1 hypothetical protein [Salmonella enterica]ECA4660981.1 hypothetical protein [Salmonella enterica subsp. enterica serovar Cerro]EEP4265983.1 hypothetical protein [Salmonella enterica subsp. enterica serovar Oranienburg]HBM0024021.1 hypothetical protein [Salmonella enterica subsp. enterica serovar Muenchen]
MSKTLCQNRTRRLVFTMLAVIVLVISCGAVFVSWLWLSFILILVPVLGYIGLPEGDRFQTLPISTLIRYLDGCTGNVWIANLLSQRTFLKYEQKDEYIHPQFLREKLNINVWSNALPRFLYPHKKSGYYCFPSPFHFLMQKIKKSNALIFYLFRE